VLAAVGLMFRRLDAPPVPSLPRDRLLRKRLDFLPHGKHSDSNGTSPERSRL
jgi:hypothetical protein